MKFSESWLREWVDPQITRQALADALTMAGLEVEELLPVAKSFTGVVVGQVVKLIPHPNSDRLQVCEVNVGAPSPLTIVCGAPNVNVGMKVAVALVNATLPNKITIALTTVRGVESQGMLCSASELSLSEDSQGLLELQDDAPLGVNLWKYLQLADFIIDLSITPNRGDCLSIKGIAREVSALTRATLQDPLSNPVLAQEGSPSGNLFHSIANVRNAISEEMLEVSVESKAGCPRYVGRVIRGVKADLITPMWMKERLRRSGVRSITPIVDVTNYVMLELGQPMHAFDLNTIKDGIIVRQSKQGEKIGLLDGSEQVLDDNTLVIADHQKPLAIAGVMGGLDSSVTLLTRDIFLESAYFSPEVVARQRQYYGLNSDSAYRFERGVDPTIQREAIERATELMIELVGGEAGVVVEKISKAQLPPEKVVTLPHEKIAQVLGVAISMNDIKDIFRALNFTYQFQKESWLIEVPPYRPDIVLPEDIIEEIARLYGYDKIPTHALRSQLQANETLETAPDLRPLRQALADQGLHEIISYSFIDKALQALFEPDETPRELINPMTAEMSVMRTSLWPGLVNTLLYNKNRQQQRVRLFEIGTCFTQRQGELSQQSKVAGLIAGFAQREQWGLPAKEVDFYDLKGIVENIFKLAGLNDKVVFKPAAHAALHPGQTAQIEYLGKPLGLLGALHPSILQALDMPNKVFVFELDLAALQEKAVYRLREVSKFPEIRRDIAILVNQAIPAEQIQDTIKTVAGDWLQNVFIFDVYQGKGVSTGLKSIALALVMQHPTRTLVDDEVAELMERIIVALKGQLGAELRS